MTKKAGKLDVEGIRQAATGRCVEILNRVAGIPNELLDGAHHPCPKCPDGGTDRFRMIDEQAGAVLCNKCFSSKNGDVFAAVAWMLDVKFSEAAEKIAEHLGVAASREPQPDDDLKFDSWCSEFAAIFCHGKKPITEAALERAGARMAMYKGLYRVICLPVIGVDLNVAKPVGWLMYPINGKLPKWNRQGEIVGWLKCKLTRGCGRGLIGAHAIERIKTTGLVELAWKVEGGTDLLALLSVIPENLADRHVVVTNANGSDETPAWQAGFLSQQKCYVIHDADEPGQTGAKADVGGGGADRWARTIAAHGEGVEVKNVQLPYEIVPDHGKDLRDYLAEGRSYADLLTLVDQAPAIVVARTESGEVDLSDMKYPVQEKILQKLQLEVLYEDESGAIRVFSSFHRKSSTIRQVERLRKETLIQICGPPAKEIISKEPDGETTWGMEDIREAIALMGGWRRGYSEERGVGAWQGLDESGNETDTIVLVGSSQGARWNSDHILRRIMSPRADGLVLDLGTAPREWYEFESLERYLKSAHEPGWRQQVVSEAIALFARWRWQHQDIDPHLITGLVLATWIQTLWEWRPLIAVKGQSHAGKSYLFKALGGDESQNRYGIFGRLAYAPDQSSEPGIRQHIRNTAIAVFLDELEKSKDRERILQMLRSSTRGGTISKGTGGAQRGVDFTIRHIVWTSATEAGLHKQPDINRYIQFELLAAEVGQHNKLRLPEWRVLQYLGQRLLAVAVFCGIEAKKLAVALKSVEVPGIDARTIESYSVPAAILTVAEGEGEEVAKAMMKRLLGNVDQSEQGRTDQDELLGDILTASIHLDGRAGVKTVGQVLQSPGLRAEYCSRVEAVGIRMLDNGDLFVAPKLVTHHLLRGTGWEGLRIDQILLRLTGAARRPLRIGGRSVRGLIVPASTIAIGEQEGQKDAFA